MTQQLKAVKILYRLTHFGVQVTFKDRSHAVLDVGVLLSFEIGSRDCAGLQLKGLDLLSGAQQMLGVCS